MLRLIRLNEQSAFTVSPGDDSDFAKTLQSDTTARFALRTQHLFVPLLDERDVPCGAIIAVTDRIREWRDHVSLDEVNFYARHIGIAVSQRQFKEERTKRESVMSGINQQVEQFPCNQSDLRRFSQSVLMSLCKSCGFHQAIIYRFDIRNEILRGFAGCNVNEINLRETMYSTEQVPLYTARADSLALTVFRRRRSIFLPTIADVVDDADRQNVGIERGCSVIGLPISARGNTHGVMLLFRRNDCVPRTPVPEPTDTFQNWLSELALTVGGVFAAAQSLQTGFADRKVRVAQSTIMRQVESLLQTEKVGGRTGERGVEDVVKYACHQREELNGVVRDAASIFGSHVAGVFLSKKPSSIPLEKIHDSTFVRHRLTRSLFYLVAGIGYRKTAYVNALDLKLEVSSCLSYSPANRGLTSHVLRTIAGQRSANVPNDKRWSQAAFEFLQVEDTEGTVVPIDSAQSADDEAMPILVSESASRAWMGVPVYADDTDHRHLYGVMTFTRFRGFVRDKLEFSEQDIATAQSIATMLAVVLQQRREVARIRKIVRSLLRTFQHDGMGDLLGLVSQTLRSMRLNAGVTNGSIDSAAEVLKFVQSIFEAFAAYVGEEANWDATRSYSVKSILDPVFNVAQHNANSVNVALVTPKLHPDELVVVDRSKTQYMIYAAIRNALRSCSESSIRGASVEVSVDVGPDLLVVVVRDNGQGLREEEQQTLFSEGYSTHHGAGLGLAMVKKFIELSRSCKRIPVPLRQKASAQIRDGDNGGAVFKVEIPNPSDSYKV